MDSVELAKDPSEGTAPSVSFETPLQVSEAETKVLREELAAIQGTLRTRILY